MTQYY